MCRNSKSLGSKPFQSLIVCFDITVPTTLYIRQHAKGVVSLRILGA